MQQNIRRKLTKFAAIGLSSAMLLVSTPLTFADAAETQNTVLTNTQEVAKQALQAYLADSQGLFVIDATAEQLQLPFSPDQYYGRSLLTEDGQKAWDYVVKELLAFNPVNDYPNLTTRNDGHGKFTINLKAAGITAPESDIKKFNKYLNGSDARMFHIRNWNQEYTKDAAGNVETVTFYIPGVYMGDNAYQNTLMGMEAYVSEVLSVVDPRMTDAQKVAALYKKYTSTMSYAWGGGKEIGNAVGALTNRIAICGGYSFGFQYILMRAGVQSIYMTGDTSEGYHAWNYVKADGQWYFVDSTWGSDRWLLKGQSSLTSHKPRTTQHFEPVPTLSETDYNLNDAKFVHVEKNTINAVKEEVKKILNEYAANLDSIDEVYVFEPSDLKMVGSETDMAIAEKIRTVIQGKYDGVITVALSNHGYNSVAEFLENGLYIGYQQSSDSPFFDYRNGKIEKY